MGRGDVTVPVVECWTTLSMAAGATVADRCRLVRAQRHEPPPGRRRADGVHPPDRERRPADRSASASAAIPRSTRPTASTSRRRRSGSRASRRPSRSSGRCGPAARSRASSPFYPLVDAAAFPVPEPAPPDHRRWRDARRARGWPAGSATAGPPSTTTSRQNLPLYLESLEASGRRREDQRVIVGFQGDWLGDESIAESPWVTEPRETWQRWQAAGADGAIVLARTTEDVDALVEAAGRW